MSADQAREIHRLASLWATARCRKLAVRLGHGAPYETPELVQDRANKAEGNLLTALAEIVAQDEKRTV